MAEPFTHRIANGFMRMVFRIFTRMEVEGRENIPSRGPLLVISNHAHGLDPPIINASLPWQVLFLAKRELVTEIHGWRRWCIIHYGLIPLDRSRLDRRAFQTALDHLSEGGVLGVFPEGTRSRTGALQRPQMGAAFLALSADAPVLPMAVTGLYGLRPALSTFFRRPHVRVRIGAPLSFPTSEGAMDRAALREAGQRMMNAIAALMPEELRGSYRKSSEDGR